MNSNGNSRHHALRRALSSGVSIAGVGFVVIMLDKHLRAAQSGIGKSASDSW
jgi:hypothetical protein